MSVSGISGSMRRSRDAQYLHLYQRCIASYRKAILDEAYCRYSQCVWNMYEVLEFFWKAIHFLHNGTYPRKHLPNLQDFNRVSTFLRNYVKPHTLTQIQSAYRRTNPSWQPNPRLRTQPRYGDEQTGQPPSGLYNRRKAKGASRVSFALAEGLAHVHRTILLQQPQLLAGILNGRFSRSRSEIKCNIAPYADGCDASDWRKLLSRTHIAKPKSRTVSELNNSLCCVINPYGESYPEKPSAPNIYPSYELIRDYIFSGGVLVTGGGMPFTYYFDVATGKQENTSTIVPQFPTAIRLIMSQGTPQVEVLSTTLLMDNLIQRDFAMKTVMDDPTSGHVGPTPLVPYQNRDDRRFWNGTNVGKTLHVFRPIDPDSSPTAIPIVRARMQGKEVFPVAFVRYGFGLLLHIGLDLRRTRKVNCDFAKEVVLGLLQNYANFFL